MLHARLVLMFVIENNEFSQALSSPQWRPSDCSPHTQSRQCTINPDHNFPLFDDLETKCHKVLFQRVCLGAGHFGVNFPFIKGAQIFVRIYLFVTEAEDVIDRRGRSWVRYKPVSPHIEHIIMLSSEADVQDPDWLCHQGIVSCINDQDDDDDGISLRCLNS